MCITRLRTVIENHKGIDWRYLDVLRNRKKFFLLFKSLCLAEIVTFSHEPRFHCAFECKTTFVRDVLQSKRKSELEVNCDDMSLEKQQLQSSLVEAEGKLANSLQVYQVA